MPNNTTRINEDSFELNGYTYTGTHTPDGQFILTSSKDGALNDRVTMQIGSDELTYETFDNIANKAANVNLASAHPQNIQALKVSDYITLAVEGSTVGTRAASAPLVGSIGSVSYTGSAGYVVNHSISFTSSLTGSATGKTFTVSAPGGTAMTVLIAAIGAGFGGIGAAIWAAIAAAAGAGTGLLITSAFTTTIYGDLYTYSILGIADDGRRVTETGAQYVGQVQKNGALVPATLYTGAYPQFISKKDRGVAILFYMDFWTETTINMNW